MLINYDMLCMGCMSPLAEDGSCPKCRYENTMPNNPWYLAAKTILAEHYVIGKILHKNCEGALYIGFDTAAGAKVWIKEYFPSDFAVRDVHDGSVHPKAGSNVQFKSYKSDFEELCSTIQGLPAKDNIAPILDIVYENETVYAIYKYIHGVPFKDYLSASYGELGWSKAKKMFMPFCTAVSNLHKLGVIHRGISPETVFVDENENLLLFGFAIPSTRTEGEMTAEFFSGYCAPEQYQYNGWQGEWTDVYAVSALLYKALTGTMPPDAMSRNNHDNLIPAIELNSNIPQNVSDAIALGMLVDTSSRIQTIDSLTANLLEATGANTAIFSAGTSSASASAQQNKQKKPKGTQGKNMLYMAMITTITILILFGVCWGVMNAYFPELIGKAPLVSSSSSSEEEQSSDSSAQSQPEVPSFVGKYVNVVYEDPEYSAKYTFRITEEYSDQYPTGIIFSQKVTQPIPQNGEIVVNLIVSKGSKVIPMPNLVGGRVEYAMKTLDDLGIPYQIFEVVDEALTAGIVSKTSVTAGDLVVREKDEVFLYTKKVIDTPPASSSSRSSSSSKASVQDSSEPEKKPKAPKASSSSRPSSSSEDEEY